MCVCVCVCVYMSAHEHKQLRKRRGGGGRERGREVVPPKLTILLSLDEGTALSRALDVSCSKITSKQPTHMCGISAWTWLHSSSHLLVMI